MIGSKQLLDQELLLLKFQTSGKCYINVKNLRKKCSWAANKTRNPSAPMQNELIHETACNNSLRSEAAMGVTGAIC